MGRMVYGKFSVRFHLIFLCWLIIFIIGGAGFCMSGGFTDNFQLGPVVVDEVKLVPPVCLVFMFADNFQLGPVVSDEVKLVPPVFLVFAFTDKIRLGSRGPGRGETRPSSFFGLCVHGKVGRFVPPGSGLDNKKPRPVKVGV